MRQRAIQAGRSVATSLATARSWSSSASRESSCAHRILLARCWASPPTSPTSPTSPSSAGRPSGSSSTTATSCGSRARSAGNLSPRRRSSPTHVRRRREYIGHHGTVPLGLKSASGGAAHALIQSEFNPILLCTKILSGANVSTTQYLSHGGRRSYSSMNSISLRGSCAIERPHPGRVLCAGHSHL